MDLLLSVQEVTYSKLDMRTGCADKRFRSFSSVPPGRCLQYFQSNHKCLSTTYSFCSKLFLHL